ncbi:hypothetical protein [Terriglobus aquaticus]|uniref:Bacteriorhodopsin n=1 Tax=Terriglobus aquaticus TaxID=940139 RepID=A0ABW9KFG4_9BACT|nr:hypothetical protein [Terriglobus aquaticus]
MPLSLVDKLLWMFGFCETTALLFVLVYKRRARSVPWFTAFIAFGVLRTILLFATYQIFGRHHEYFLAYWGAAAVDLALQVAVVYEVARAIFERSGAWVPMARRRFFTIATLAPLVALCLALTMQPAARSALDAWDARADLFLTTVICVLCGAVTTVSRQLGLGWRTRIIRFMWGLIVWTLSAFFTGSLHAYWRTVDQFGKLENAVVVVYQLVTLYWCVVFWLPEPDRRRDPYSLNKDLEEVRQRVHLGGRPTL